MRLNKNRLKILRILTRAAAGGRCLTIDEVAAALCMPNSRVRKLLRRAAGIGLIRGVQDTYTTPWPMSEEALARQGAGNFILEPLKRPSRKKLLAMARVLRYRGLTVAETAAALNVSKSWITHRVPKEMSHGRHYKFHMRGLSAPRNR